MRPRIYMWLLPLGALLLAPLSCADDDEHCGADDGTRCVDNAMQYCNHEQGMWRGFDDCGKRYCRELTDGSHQCVENPEPDERCTEANERWCISSARIAICRGGYLSEGACSGGNECVEVLGDALCVSPAQSPDPRCPAEPGYGGICEGDTLVSCYAGYLQVEMACGTLGCPEGCTQGD